MSCDRCPSCPGTHMVVCGDGPKNADVMFVGDTSGKEPKPMIGRIGREFNEHYLRLAGFARQDVYVTNSVKCNLGDKSKGASAELVKSCVEHHLVREIAEVQPRLIVPMGAGALRALQIVSKGIEHLDLDIHHGHVFHPTNEDFSIYLSYHPTMGMHGGRFMLQLMRDFDRLRLVRQGRFVGPTDPYPNPRYREIKNTFDLKLAINRDNTVGMGYDTEDDSYGAPWSLQFSVEDGTGYLIRIHKTELVQEFSRYARKWKGFIYIHNATHDLRTNQRAGIEMPIRRVKDTMVRAYHRGGIVPQGLKALGFQLLGVQMKSFMDVCYPHSRKLALAYMQRIAEITWPKPDEEVVFDTDKDDYKLYKPQGLNTKIKRMFTDYKKNAELDVFERWEKWGKSDPNIHAMVESECGRFPLPGIEHVPEDEAIVYGCRDADVGRRIGPALEGVKVK